MTARQDLETFLDKYDPAVARTARAVLAAMRRRLPGAFELVYDNYNALAIGFSPTEKTSDGVFSIAVYPRWVSLFFLRGGPSLPDPAKRLRGAGTTVRHVVLDDGAATLDDAPIRALMGVALERAGWAPRGGRGTIVIKSVAAKQRPRRTAAAQRNVKVRA